MGRKSKKTKAAGKFGSAFGTRTRAAFNAIDGPQRKFQQSPFHPTGRARRISAGIWQCVKTGRIFAGHAYYLQAKK